MSELKEVTLDSIIEIFGGGTPRTSNQKFWGGKIHWLSVVDFNNGNKYVKQTEKHITELGLERSSTRLLCNDDIIISARGTVGAMAMLAKPMAFNQSCYGIRAKSHIADQHFIYYLLKESVEDFLQYSHGGVFNTITRDTFKEIDVKLPPLPEQRATAEVLSSLDDKIDLLHRQNKTLEQLAETLFRQWFIEEAKEEWEEGTLNDLVEKANTGLDAIRRAPIVAEETGVKCLRIQDISQKKPFNNWGNSKVNNSDYEKARLIKGDIIMARTCSPGIMLYVHEDMNAVFNNGLARIRPNLEKANSHFLYYMFKTEDFIGHIYGISDGTSVQLNMKLGDLLSYPVKIPPKRLLDEKARYFEDFHDRILHNESEIKTLENLRDTLLPKLMSGEVRVNELTK